ncbi:MAG: hypothetical protein AAGJ70_13620, partial [Pseudomonadota bacterium]
RLAHTRFNTFAQGEEGVTFAILGEAQVIEDVSIGAKKRVKRRRPQLARTAGCLFRLVLRPRMGVARAPGCDGGRICAA